MWVFQTKTVTTNIAEIFISLKYILKSLTSRSEELKELMFHKVVTLLSPSRLSCLAYFGSGILSTVNSDVSF